MVDVKHFDESVAGAYKELIMVQCMNGIQRVLVDEGPLYVTIGGIHDMCMTIKTDCDQPSPNHRDISNCVSVVCHD
jgi:hypothetical protein